MFDFNQDVFQTSITIPASARIIFVADLFVEDYVGGAELTTQALIDSSPLEVFKLKSRDVTLQLLEKAADRFWVFGNFTELNPQLIPSIVGNVKYSILEYDYKYCKLRSPEKHIEVTKSPCDCHNQMNGKIISAFFYGAMHIWWMSEKQREKYMTMFPFLSERNNTVLSSVFDDRTLGFIKALRIANVDKERKGWIVLGSSSWIKGAEAAKRWCEENKKDHEIVWDLPYDQLLKRLASAKGFVYLPAGGDTCPRMVIEAKLLGCELHLNEYVQHKDEEWFATDDINAIEEYLYTARKTFWSGIKQAMDYKASISGYVTTYNCVDQTYPFEQCIESMLGFCNEVCIVDGGSTDATLDRLVSKYWKPNEGEKYTHHDVAQEVRRGVPLRCKLSDGKSVVIKVIRRDWKHPRSAVFDGLQKAEARALCTNEFCWQMDSDEIVHEDDYDRVQDLCRSLPKNADIVSLPVIEFWGDEGKVRADIQPWKWRLTRNSKNITHGIPGRLRKVDENGHTFSAPGSDGCDLIDSETLEPLPHISFYTPDVENVRLTAMLGNKQALQQYESWFNQAVSGIPCVFHYSWFDIERKIKLYRDFWTRHWEVLSGNEFIDSPEQNMMFDVSWKDVTDDMIKARAKELALKTGGHIWHRKWDGTTTPHITCSRSHPAVMQDLVKTKLSV
jgi:glycosyltransferase involved in cell wall biosynthesis